jgi:hypothetical protein
VRAQLETVTADAAVSTSPNTRDESQGVETRGGVRAETVLPEQFGRLFEERERLHLTRRRQPDECEVLQRLCDLRLVVDPARARMSERCDRTRPARVHPA